MSKKRKRWLPEWNVLLGTLPDSVLSQQLAIAEGAIRLRRWKLGIPTFSGLRVFPCAWCGKDVMRVREHHSISCDECKRVNEKETNREYREANRPKRRAQMRAWSAANRERLGEWHRKWYATHPKNVAVYRQRSYALAKLKRRTAREAAIDARVEAEIRAERDHYGWARNVE